MTDFARTRSLWFPIKSDDSRTSQRDQQRYSAQTNPHRRAIGKTLALHCSKFDRLSGSITLALRHLSSFFSTLCLMKFWHGLPWFQSKIERVLILCALTRVCMCVWFLFTKFGLLFFFYDGPLFSSCQPTSRLRPLCWRTLDNPTTTAAYIP